MRLALFLLALFLIPFVVADCEEDQIDINSASLEELDTLSGIGPAKAQEIVNSRPFDSVDDLIDVKGIGEVTLNNIKTQGLACVSESEGDEEVEEESEKEEEVEETVEEVESIPEPEMKTINLSPKAINTDTSKESLRKELALGGFAAFAVLLSVLFLIKRKRKNEFR